MFLGFGLGLTGTQRRRFTPAALFTNGESGAWYDPSDLGTLWADTAGTVPASVDGAVARMDDKSGNDNHATQATVAARPILRQSGGLTWLEFDGVDDFMQVIPVNFLVTASGWELFIALKLNSAGNVNRKIFAFDDGGNSNLGWFGTSNSGNEEWDAAGSAEDIAIAATWGPNDVNSHVFYIDFAGDSIRQDGAVPSYSPSPYSNVTANLTDIVIGRRAWSNTGNTDMNFFGAIARVDAATTTEINNTEAYLAAKTGVTL